MSRQADPGRSVGTLDPVTTATTLQGSLADIGVADLLALLSGRARSGVLLVNPSSPLRLTLAHGSVVIGGSTSTMALGRYLLAAGLVSAEDLEQLFGLVQGRLGERRTRALDETQVLEALSRAVPVDALRTATRRLAVSTVFDMMMIGDAPMVFTESAPHPIAERFAHAVDEVADAAAEQVLAWPALSAAVGGEDARMRRVPRLSAASTPVMLDALDWAALSEIDDRATVGQVAHRLGLGRSDGATVVAGLLERRVIEPA